MLAVPSLPLSFQRNGQLKHHQNLCEHPPQDPWCSLSSRWSLSLASVPNTITTSFQKLLNSCSFCWVLDLRYIWEAWLSFSQNCKVLSDQHCQDGCVTCQHPSWYLMVTLQKLEAKKTIQGNTWPLLLPWIKSLGSSFLGADIQVHIGYQHLSKLFWKCRG